MPHFNPRSPCGERPFAPMFRAAMYYFNPRSPCGERRPKTELSPIWTLFQSTLPVRGATGSRAWHWPPDNDFNPRSPCGERLYDYRYINIPGQISIHAPRAGSDTIDLCNLLRGPNFNPRSPCGERLRDIAPVSPRGVISIHAPRAGSDGTFSFRKGFTRISIHAPRAGSDVFTPVTVASSTDFNPRSPCGERQRRCPKRNRLF